MPVRTFVRLLRDVRRWSRTPLAYAMLAMSKLLVKTGLSLGEAGLWLEASARARIGRSRKGPADMSARGPEQKLPVLAGMSIAVAASLAVWILILLVLRGCA